MSVPGKKFSAKRWTDIPKPIVGHSEFAEAEKKENEQKLEEIMRAYGVLKPNEHIQEGRGCGRFLGPELSNSKTASILHWTQTP